MKTFLFIILSFCCYAQAQYSIPRESSQLIVVVTDTISSVKGSLSIYERDNSGKWNKLRSGIPVALGKNGLAWGSGVYNSAPAGFPFKKEGDGCSPAGLFFLGPAFGFESPEKVTQLKVPYIHINDMLECIDDTASMHYNKLVYRDQLNSDWQSSEKMKAYGKWYDQGIVIMYNRNPEIKGAGSCVFLHNWVNPDETSLGCTEMEPRELKKIMYWLDSAKNPMILQIPEFLYRMAAAAEGL